MRAVLSRISQTCVNVLLQLCGGQLREGTARCHDNGRAMPFCLFPPFLSLHVASNSWNIGGTQYGWETTNWSSGSLIKVRGRLLQSEKHWSSYKEIKGEKGRKTGATFDKAYFWKWPTYALKTSHGSWMEIPLVAPLESQFPIIEKNVKIWRSS